MKTIITVLIAFMFILPSVTFAKGKKHSRKPSQHKQHHAQKMENKIKKQHERKTKKLESWKTKKTEKCGTDQACVDKVNKVYTKKQEQVEKQQAKRTQTLEKFKEKHIEETPVASEPAPEASKTP